MADTPDDEEQETFIQKAVKVGLITIPLMMYVSWAYKKFVPCPKVKCHQPRAPPFKKSGAKGKRKNKKGKCTESKPAKQDTKMKRCEDSSSTDRNYDQQLSPCVETNERDVGSAKDKYMDYLKRSTKECCESVSKHVKGYSGAAKTDAEQPSDSHQHKRKINDPCSEQVKEEKTEGDTFTQPDTQSDTISPEAFDKLFEEHFQKCVDDFKQHKIKVEKELERLRDSCETEQKNEKPDEANQKGNYLECLADLNLDKDFGCDPNFHSKDSDAQYIVKGYKCKSSTDKAAKEGRSEKNERNTNGYLKCLTDLNLDKNFEEKQERQSSYGGKKGSTECCKGNGNDTKAQKKTDECKTNSNYKTEELCEKTAVKSEFSTKDLADSVYGKAKMDDCGCDPHFNTKNTNKYGRTKGDPCQDRSVKEDDTDDDALKDFWHACGPPKGLRKGCWAEGCDNPCDKRK